MKSVLNKKWYGVPVLVFALVAMLGVGAVYAAMTMTTHGTVTVVPSGGTGGGGGGGTQVPTYTFKVWDAVTAGNEIAAEDSAFFNLGTINVSSFTEKTVYIEKTGNQTVTVTPTVTNLDAATGTITFTPTSVTVTDTTRLPIVVRFTSGNSTAAADAFDITFTGSP